MKKFLSIVGVIMIVFLLSVPVWAEDASGEGSASGGGAGAALPSGNSLSPNLVISNFSIGGDAVTAGKNFTLSYTLYNTNRNISVQNLTVKINGGDKFSLNKETDTRYVEKIKPRGAIELTSHFTTSVDLQPGSYPVAVNVGYEYYDSGTKYTGAAELSISVPVKQDDRVTIVKASIGDKDEPVYVNEEYGVEYDFINTGFSKMLNTQMSLYNDSDQLVSTAYVGTVNPSAEMSGSSYLYATFGSTGEKTMKLVITYEDQNTNSHSVESEFTVNVEDVPPPVVEEQVQGENNFLLWGVIFILVIIAVVVLIIVLRRRKKKKLAQEDLWDDDDDDLEDDDFEDSDTDIKEDDSDSPNGKGEKDEDN